MHSCRPNSMRFQAGVTLLELMIVVVIVAMIAAFAYPSYVDHVVDTKRTAANSVLMQVADRQQQFFMDNKRYSNDLAELGFASNPLPVADDGRPLAAGDIDTAYLVSLGNVTATTYTATAAPQHGQATRDVDCGALTLNQAGTKGHAGPGDDCWR